MSGISLYGLLAASASGTYSTLGSALNFGSINLYSSGIYSTLNASSFPFYNTFLTNSPSGNFTSFVSSGYIKWRTI